MAVPKVIFDRRLSMTLSAVLLYLALIVVITYTLGKGMAIASIIPVVVIAWMYGFRAGILAGALSAPVNIGLFMLMGLDWVEKFYVGGVGVAATLIEIFIGGIVGKLHDYYRRLQEELGVKKVLEAELQQHRTRLEEMVQAKTVELAASNQQLRATLEQLQASQSDLQQAQDFMESTFHCALEGLIVADARGYVIVANRSLEKMLGYGVGELVGRYFDEFVYAEGDYHARTMKLMKEFAEKQFVENAEAMFKRRDGSIFSVELNCRFLKNDKDEIIGSVNSVRDITIRKQAERELQQSRDFLADIFRATPDMIVVTDSRGDITAVNDAVQQVLGYSPDELVGQSTALLLPEDDKSRQGGLALMVEFFEKGRIDNREFLLQKKDKTTCLVEWHSIMEQDEQGNITGSIGVMRDCTARKKMEQQLQQAQKMEAIGTLAGGIAHDFNNILAAIAGFADLSLQAVGDGTLKNYISYIVKASNRAKDLVRQILAFSRPTEQELRPVRIVPLLQEALKFLRATLPSSIDIRQNIACDGDVVFADPTQVHQVIMNLCTNAGHAMREQGGVLTVGLDTLRIDESLINKRYTELSPGQYVRLTVSDTGHGMTRELCEHIFEPYFTTKDTGEGTGLGLAVVHGIVKSHKGMVFVSSEPDKGSTFDIVLPLMAIEDQPPVAETPLPLGTGESVLFVDDEKDLTIMARTLLEDLGYRVTVTTTPQEALDLIGRNSAAFDLLITDKTMPDMNGFELAETVFAVAPKLPVIMVTGLVQKEDTAKARKTGIKEFLGKPFHVQEIAVKIRSALEAVKSS
jgi:PAS domain S-box-containing protein